MIKTYKRTLKHHTDPAHGWVGVSLTELSSLGLIDDITHYSYISTDGNGVKFVYLEEDHDLGLYINKLKSLNIDYSIEDGTYTDGEHWIRSLENYNLGKGAIR
jgi:hypothetical protein